MAASDTKNTNSSNSADDASVTVRLLARSWQRRVPDSDPPVFKRYFQGAEIDITQHEYDILTTDQVKQTIQLVQDEAQSQAPAQAPAQSQPASNSGTSTTTPSSSS